MTPRKRKFVLRCNVELSLEDCLRRKRCNIRLRDEVHLNTICCTDAALTDVGIVCRFNGLDIVIILAVQYLDRLNIISIRRQIGLDDDRRIALRINEIILRYIVERCFRRCIRHAIGCLFRKPIRYNLQLALTPYRRGICCFKQCCNQFVRFFLAVIRRRKIDAIDGAIILKLRGICKIFRRESHTDLHIR